MNEWERWLAHRQRLVSWAMLGMLIIGVALGHLLATLIADDVPFWPQIPLVLAASGSTVRMYALRRRAPVRPGRVDGAREEQGPRPPTLERLEDRMSRYPALTAATATVVALLAALVTLLD